MEYSNPYSYVANRPMNFVDPLGMKRHREYGRNEEAGPVRFGFLAGGGIMGTSYYVDGVEVTGDLFYSAAGVENYSEYVYNSIGHYEKKKKSKIVRTEIPDVTEIEFDKDGNPIIKVTAPYKRIEYWEYEWVDAKVDLRKLSQQRYMADGLSGLSTMFGPMSAFWSGSGNLQPLGKFAGRAGTAFGVFAWAANSAYLGNKYGWDGLTDRYDWRFSTWTTGIGMSVGLGVGLINPWLGYATGFAASQVTGMIINAVYDKPWRNNTLFDPRIW